MKINYINKKVVAVSLSSVIITSAFTGCKVVKEKRVVDKSISDTISYSDITNLYVVSTKDSNSKKDIYIARKECEIDENNMTINYYYDIFTGKEIIFNYDEEGVNIYLLEDFLISYNEVKSLYTFDDIKRIYDEIQKDLLLKNLSVNKILKKENI